MSHKKSICLAAPTISQDRLQCTCLLIALCISGECIAVFAEAFRQNLFDDPNVVFVTNGNAICSG